MTDDLVDRISKARNDKAEAISRSNRIALLQAESVEQDSDSLWLGVIKATNSLVEKYNESFPRDRLVISERQGSPPQGFDLERTLCPIARLSVWRNSPRLIEFFFLRAESFGNERTARGRIEIKVDEDLNVYLAADGKVMATLKEAAEYLLNKVFEL